MKRLTLNLVPSIGDDEQLMRPSFKWPLKCAGTVSFDPLKTEGILRKLQKVITTLPKVEGFQK
jgi:hypothetical protein